MSDNEIEITAESIDKLISACSDKIAQMRDLAKQARTKADQLEAYADKLESAQIDFQNSIKGKI